MTLSPELAGFLNFLENKTKNYQNEYNVNPSLLLTSKMHDTFGENFGYLGFTLAGMSGSE